MTNKDLRNFLLPLAALAMLVSPVVAQGRGQGNAHKQQDKNRVVQDDGDQGKNQDRDVGNQETRKGRVDVQRTGPIFGPRARDVIGGYYRNRYSNLPPGLAKRGGNLPPGLERQLQRNGTLPPGLQKRLEPFPADLRRQLPRLPANYAYGVIDGSAIILNQRTSTIVDVIYDILNRSGIADSNRKGRSE